MSEIVETLFLRTWWSWSRDRALSYSAAYHWFNLAEGLAWFVFAVLVIRRHRRRRCGGIELWYAAAFLAFGLTDFVEAWVQTSWLLWTKLANLIVLLWLRRVVMARCSPDSRFF